MKTFYHTAASRRGTDCHVADAPRNDEEGTDCHVTDVSRNDEEGTDCHVTDVPRNDEGGRIALKYPSTKLRLVPLPLGQGRHVMERNYR